MELLIVEDDPHVALLLAEWVERWGYGAESAATGKDALEIARQKRFELVLLDIFLPDCRGDQLIQQLKEIRPGIGVITMTGENTRELEWEIRQQGILYYMTKPLDMKALKALVDHTAKRIGKEQSVA